MPRWVTHVLLILLTLSVLPFACIYKARGTLSPQPRIHLIQGMDNQPRFKSQQVNPLFADTRSDRPFVEGTIARGTLNEDTATTKGIVDQKWADAFPVPLNEVLLKRGQERFNIYCAPCHGLSGYGDGIVGKRADRLQEGTWVPPASMHDPTVLARPVGHLFNTITNGIRTMPAYGPQISVADRWAIVAYVRALQRSQHATMKDVPAEAVAKLAGEVSK